MGKQGELRKRKKAAGIPRVLPWTVTARRVTESDTDERGDWSRQKTIARQAEFLRRGGGAHAAGGEARNESALVAAGRKNVSDVIASGGKAARSAPQYEEAVSSYENFVLFAMRDDHPEHQRLVQMENALFPNDDGNAKAGGAQAAGDDTASLPAVVKIPAHKDAVKAYLNVMSSPSTTEFEAESERFKGTKFCGRATSHPTQIKFPSAQRRYDSCIAGRTDLLDGDIVELSGTTRKEHHGDSAPSFDIEVALPLLREAIFRAENDGKSNPLNTGLQRQELWTMLHLSLVCISRASLFTTFCPLLDQLELGGVQSDGLPSYVVLTLKAWKGNAEGHKTQRLVIRRNMMHPEYCPVVTLLNWVKVLHTEGIHHGPLFPALNNAHTNFLRDHRTNGLQRWGVDAYRKTVSSIFEYVGGPLAQCTSHSIRHSAVKWAARCKARQADVMRGGRWTENSAKFMLYWNQGELKSREMLELTREEDPIFNFWVWEPTSFEATDGG